MKTDSIQTQLIQEFSKFSSWEDRYRKIISLGKEMVPLPDELKSDDLKVKGCQSQVWLWARMDEEGKVRFQADSDALIVRGLIAILLKIYSGRVPREILEIQPDFIDELGLASHLSPSRANGLHAMVKQIKYYALAFSKI